MGRINAYIVNVSNLLPDSVTQQNIWAAGPVNSVLWGLGMSGNLTFFNKKSLGSMADSTAEFSGAGADLESFPTNIPFLPGVSVDLRGGTRLFNTPLAFDIGLSGMYYNASSILPKGNTFITWTFGFDVRVSILQEGMFGGISPALFAQGGYYFNSLRMGFEANWDAMYGGETRHFDEYVKMNFRTGTVFGAVQVSKKLSIFTPYFGYKGIVCDKDSDFSWGTSRNVQFRGTTYPKGMDYKSGGIDGEPKLYHELYGGTALFGQFITLGIAYNFITEHLGINLSLKINHVGKYRP
jgi:hypothetical protein